jgi:two-component system, NtrC family, nitrogen regulation sensor histidine kinase NtrY
VFDRCTETIIRQVGDIGRMVDEFSTFARMPKPVLEQANLSTIAKDAVFLVEVSRSDIQFKLEGGGMPFVGLFDPRMMGQAIGNLVKNAAEAIDSKIETLAEGNAAADYSGKITVRLYDQDGRLQLDIIDNGKGFPETDRQRLLEPYMTTRAKGTGLGLAIVKKIVEEHGGTLDLADAPSEFGIESGAMVRLTFPALTDAQSTLPLASPDMTETALERV